MRKKALTLIELILGLILISGTIAVVSGSLIFLVNQLQANMERSAIHGQLNYAVEDMKLRCVSALNLANYFSVGIDDKSELTFEGECGMYSVSLNSRDDNCTYRYFVDGNNNLMLNCVSAGGVCPFNNELLVEGKFRPTLNFHSNSALGLNLLTVNLTAQSTTTHRIPLGADRDGLVHKTGGIRFWFIDVIQQ